MAASEEIESIQMTLSVDDEPNARRGLYTLITIALYILNIEAE